MGCFGNMPWGPPCTQLITPLVYDESLSYEQQIAAIMGQLNKLATSLNGYVTKEAFEAYGKAIELEQAAQKIEWESYTDEAVKALSLKLVNEVNRLEQIIAGIVAGQVIAYDPTHGQEERSINVVVERIYDFDREFSITAVDFDSVGFTAGQLDSYLMSTRDVDVAAALILMNRREDGE